MKNKIVGWLCVSSVILLILYILSRTYIEIFFLLAATLVGVSVGQLICYGFTLLYKEYRK